MTEEVSKELSEAIDSMFAQVAQSRARVDKLEENVNELIKMLKEDAENAACSLRNASELPGHFREYLRGV